MHNYFYLKNKEHYPYVILVNQKQLKPKELILGFQLSSHAEDFLFLGLPTEESGKKIPKAQLKTYLANALLDLQAVKPLRLLVSDATYYELLTGNKLAKSLGTIYRSEKYPFEILCTYSYSACFYNPDLKIEIQKSIEQCLSGVDRSPQFEFKELRCPNTLAELETCLKSLYAYPVLGLDIETTGLYFTEAQIVSIAFAYDDFKAVSFEVSYSEALWALLYDFFKNYKGKWVLHNANFDCKFLIFNFFMKHDFKHKEKMLEGLHTLYKNLEDTKLMAYLCFNSTLRPKLSLKDLTYEFMGDYGLGEEIKDLSRIDRSRLLEYNAKDACATLILYKKLSTLLYEEAQEEIYETLFKPSLKTMALAELVGMPINLEKVKQIKETLSQEYEDCLAWLKTQEVVLKTNDLLVEQNWKAANALLKVKKHPKSHFEKYWFNPNSTKHLALLLFTVLGFKVVDYTEAGQPATGSDVLVKLLSQEKEIKLLETLIKIKQISKIITSFIPAFLKASFHGDYFALHGSFNLGGTLSGRLSSSEP